MQRVTSDKTNFSLHFKILNAFSILNLGTQISLI